MQPPSPLLRGQGLGKPPQETGNALFPLAWTSARFTHRRLHPDREVHFERGQEVKNQAGALNFCLCLRERPGTGYFLEAFSCR